MSIQDRTQAPCPPLPDDQLRDLAALSEVARLLNCQLHPWDARYTSVPQSLSHKVISVRISGGELLVELEGRNELRIRVAGGGEVRR